MAPYCHLMSQLAAKKKSIKSNEEKIQKELNFNSTNMQV